jgi:hypothetical protein
MIDVKRKKLINILAIVLIAQVIIILALKIFSMQNIKAMTIGKKMIKNFNKEAVLSLEISDFKDSFTVDKKGANWLVNTKGKELPCDVAKINSYLDILRNLPEGVVKDKGDNPKNESLYGLDKERYQKFAIKSDKKKDFVIYIGHAGLSIGTSYIRVNTEKKIREVKSVISNETGNKPVNWAKKRIFDDKLTVEDVDKFIVDSSLGWFRGNYSIEYKEAKDEKGNIIKDNFIIIPPVNQKLSEFELQNVITGLINLTATDYKLTGDVSQKEKLANIKLVLKNGKSYNVYIYKTDKDDIGEYIIDVDFNNYLYTVREGDVKRFIKAKTDLVEKDNK